MSQAGADWDPDRYDGEHAFVYEYGEDVVGLLAPLCEDPAPLHAWQERVRALGFQPGTLAIAEHLAALVEGP